MRRIWAIVMLMVAAACGGGGDGFETPTTQAPLGEPAGDPSVATTADSGNRTPEIFGIDQDNVLVELDLDALETNELAETPNGNWLWMINGQPWVGHTEGLIAFDVTGSEIGRYDMWGPSGMASGPEGEIWAVSLAQSSPNGFLHKIEGETITVSLESDATVFFGRVEVGGGSVWVTHTSTNERTEILRVDPDSVEVLGSTTLDLEPFAIAYGADTLWAIGPLVEGDHDIIGIARIQPDGESFETLLVPGAHRQSDIVFGFGSAWYIDATGTDVVRIDPATNDEVARINVGGHSGDHPFLTRVHIGSDAVWVNNPAADTLYKIDPETNEIVTEIGHGLRALAFR